MPLMAFILHCLRVMKMKMVNTSHLISIYHPYSLETWLIITNVRDEYDEEREIDFYEINFEDMVNHFISQHLPGLHINI
jgi:hypothetical protein